MKRTLQGGGEVLQLLLELRGQSQVVPAAVLNLLLSQTVRRHSKLVEISFDHVPNHVTNHLTVGL